MKLKENEIIIHCIFYYIHFIIHGLFVDEMMHIATNNKRKNKFMEKYLRDFNITGGGFMKTFLGMEIEQSKR